MISQGFEKIFKNGNNEEDVERILDAVDTNKSGAIDYMGLKILAYFSCLYDNFIRISCGSD